MLSGVLQAEEGASTLAELETSVHSLQGQLDELKQELAQTHQDLEVQKQENTLPDWVKNIANFKVDFRYRYIWKDDHQSSVGSEKDNYNDIRARLALFGHVNEDIDLVFRVQSGVDQLGTSVLGDVTAKVDLAYVDYHPGDLNKLPFIGIGAEYADGIVPFFELDEVEGIHLLGGIFEDPFYHPGGSKLIMDTNFEGAAGTFRKRIKCINVDAFGAMGASWVERRSGQADTALFGGQLGGICDLGDDMNMKAAVSYYQFTNVKGKAEIDAFSGNSNTSNGVENTYDNEYNLLNLSGEFNMKCCDIPCKIFGDYVNNTRNTTGGDDGYMVGAIIGQAKKLGDVRVKYNWREIQKDAIFGAIGVGDFGLGADTRGHLVDVGVTLIKNCVAGVCGKFGERFVSGENDPDYYLVCGYFVAKF